MHVIKPVWPLTFHVQSRGSQCRCTAIFCLWKGPFSLTPKRRAQVLGQLSCIQSTRRRSAQETIDKVGVKVLICVCKIAKFSGGKWVFTSPKSLNYRAGICLPDFRLMLFLLYVPSLLLQQTRVRWPAMWQANGGWSFCLFSVSGTCTRLPWNRKSIGGGGFRWNSGMHLLRIVWSAKWSALQDPVYGEPSYIIYFERRYCQV